MISLKQLCNCIDLKGKISIVHDFFGFAIGVPSGKTVSVLSQCKLLKGKHIHVNFIRVGNFTNDDYKEVDEALWLMRDIYSTVNLGVGRVKWYYIPSEDLDGKDHIDNHGEAVDLTNDWTVPNHALDIFFVLTYAGSTVGYSRIDGPCNKDAKGMDGSVVAIESSPNITGLVLAHEAAHYLGLNHVNDSTNLMNPSVPNDGRLTNNQGNIMKKHCFVNDGC